MWDSGYVETERFDAEWWFGISGLIAGPARGIIWYSPALLLAIPSAKLFWRQARPVFLFCVTLSLLYVLLYGKWYMWHGGYSWGPRFLAPILPFLALLTGPIIEQTFVHRAGGLIGAFRHLGFGLVFRGRAMAGPADPLWLCARLYSRHLHTPLCA